MHPVRRPPHQCQPERGDASVKEDRSESWDHDGGSQRTGITRVARHRRPIPDGRPGATLPSGGTELTVSIAPGESRCLVERLKENPCNAPTARTASSPASP